MKILLRSGKSESAGVARCIALSSLGIFIYQQLCQVHILPTHPKIKEAINTLLLALRVSLEKNGGCAGPFYNYVTVFLNSIVFMLISRFPNPNSIVELLGPQTTKMVSWYLTVEFANCRLQLSKN